MAYFEENTLESRWLKFLSFPYAIAICILFFSQLNSYTGVYRWLTKMQTIIFDNVYSDKLSFVLFFLIFVPILIFSAKWFAKTNKEPPNLKGLSRKFTNFSANQVTYSLKFQVIGITLLGLAGWNYIQSRQHTQQVEITDSVTFEKTMDPPAWIKFKGNIRTDFYVKKDYTYYYLIWNGSEDNNVPHRIFFSGGSPDRLEKILAKGEFSAMRDYTGVPGDVRQLFESENFKLAGNIYAYDVDESPSKKASFAMGLATFGLFFLVPAYLRRRWVARKQKKLEELGGRDKLSA